jgi:uncharacterized cupin superfamily protein
MSDPNVFDAPFEFDGDEPPGYAAGEAVGIGKAAGGAALTVRVFDLPAGQSLCPYHYEYEEEWLLVLDGEVTLRVPAGERALSRGALVCFPPGPDGAHKVSCRGESAARVLMFSSAREPAVSVYPDSDKIGVWPPNRDDAVMLRRANGKVDYWEGER